MGDKAMKKTIVIAAMALLSLMTVSCGNTKDNNKAPETASQSAYSSQAESKTFSQIPQGAEKALDVAAQRSEKAFETSGARSFGYIGTAEVKGSECYCFSVYDKNDENTQHVADIAVTADGEKVYSAIAGQKDYSELKAPVVKESWNQRSTPAFSK